VSVAASPATAPPTIWGLTPHQIHDRFWAAFGVQVVRRGEPSEIVEGAELFLLCEPATLVIFRLPEIVDTLYWLEPRLLVLRLRDTRPRAYSERAVTDGDRLVRFERVYRDARARSVRVALTTDPKLAKAWQNAPHEVAPWRWLRAQVPSDLRLVRAASARVYDEGDDAQVMECLRDLMRYWTHPAATVGRVLSPVAGLWCDATAGVGDGVRCVGPVWVGAGRRLEPGLRVVGPAILWDRPDARPAVEDVRWQELEPTSIAAGGIRRVRARPVPGKRLFDIVFSLVALAATLPLYPVVMLAILIEDGRPFFFVHRRETVGGREFGCIKFRSMRKDSDAIKARLAKENQADGPQFYIKDDPRMTRVGRVLRAAQIDEIPQFVNVLLGDMSVVGPRPSPHSENQYCPAWREARLSVRPGVTGLWQVSRTRRQGLDFQEWIKFDLEYVENASWSLDLRILVRTVGVVLGGIF
jgi:lipopolysaccharide/colanic/teichoic acid biosynthesis glycosyltransferase